MTLKNALRHIIEDPGELLLRRWNWKSALFSSLFRASIFFSVNLTAGFRAASGAALAEFAYRALTAGFYGALTQHFRKVEPHWHATVAALILLPVVAHSIELAIHYLRGTPKLAASITASVCFTILATLFNLYVMRRNAMVVGAEGDSFWRDMRRMPALVAGFAAAGPVALYRWARGDQVRSRR